MKREIIGEYKGYKLEKIIQYKKNSAGEDTLVSDSETYEIIGPNGLIDSPLTLSEAIDAFVALLNELFPLDPKPITYKK